MGNELYDWRKKNLDSISPSFCAAKWYNTSIHLGSGGTMSCHLPLPHMIQAGEDELRWNPSLIHNTNHKKKMRRLMLDGERPHEYDYCWKVEDIGRENVSDRVFKSMIYKVEDIKKIPLREHTDDIIPKTMEISFDRICQFSCSYCNAGYSTEWARQMKQNGAFQHLKSDGRGAYHHDGSWADPYGKFNTGNPYVEAFFRWWPKLRTELQEIRITGGEATMSHNFWRFMEMLSKEENPNLRIAVNTNFGMKQELLEKLVHSTNTCKVREFDIYTSNESYGKHANYIRAGLDYDKWRSNLVYMLEHGKPRAITIMMTINSLCLFSITEFMDDMITLKDRFGNNKPMLDLNILRWPSFMSPVVLPDHLKNSLREKLKLWYEEARQKKLSKDGFPAIQIGEGSQIQRLIDYIEVVEKPHVRVGNKEDLQHDFRAFYEQYDKRNGFDFWTTFPYELIQWYDNIKVDYHGPHQPLGDGTPQHHGYNK